MSENKKFVILDYGVGNIQSLYNAFSKFCNVEISRDKNVLENADCIIFPGVGTFYSAMKSICDNDLYDLLQKHKYEKYFFGICLGMQIMFEKSEESPGIKGLGFFEGECKKLSNRIDKVPHIGWKDVWDFDAIERKRIISGVAYFCHSYFVLPVDDTIQNEEFFQHGGDIGIYLAKFQTDRMLATQYHPEKSGKYGLTLIENYVKLVNGVK